MRTWTRPSDHARLPSTRGTHRLVVVRMIKDEFVWRVFYFCTECSDRDALESSKCRRPCDRDSAVIRCTATMGATGGTFGFFLVQYFWIPERPEPHQGA